MGVLVGVGVGVLVGVGVSVLVGVGVGVAVGGMGVGVLVGVGVGVLVGVGVGVGVLVGVGVGVSVGATSNTYRIPRVCESPAVTFNQTSESTCLGVFSSPPIVPRPSWPLLLLPQVNNLPSVRIATVWRPPAETSVQRAVEI